MADRGDTHYSVPALNKWFLFSSVAILIATGWMMIDDWQRPWKAYQREFRVLETDKVRDKEKELTAAGALARESELSAQVQAAGERVTANQAKIAEVTERLRLAKGELWNAIEAAKKAKSAYNWDRYVLEEERLHKGDATWGQDKLDASEAAMNVAAGIQQELEGKRNVIELELSALTRDLDVAQKSFSVGTRDLEQVRKRLSQLDPSAMTGPEKLADVVRDAPGLDFVKPNLKVNKVVLDKLTFELNFTKKKRIDMCQTCHLGAERSGFEGAAQPFTTHPRLDLFLSSKSPHPTSEFGCTICHRGSGEALDFVRADHRPTDKGEQAQWEQDHHWHKQHHWDYPMLASEFTEASCVQCHKTTMDLIADDAPVVAKGYQLVEQYACYSCHKIEWFPTKRRTGPTLANLQGKLSPEFITSWITNPKDFRPTTWMPQFFHLENYAPGETIVKSKYGAGRNIEGREWDDAAISAVTAFLLDRAPKQAMPPMPVQGDAHRGRETMRLSGCFACHNMAPFGEEPAAMDPALERRGTNEHGPNLRGVATKLSPEWLFQWIKDPTQYWADTRMPNLRLSDQEAADITAYITEDPDGYFHDVPEGWAPKRIEMPEQQLREVLGEQARWFFARDGRTTIEERLEKGTWSDTQKLLVDVGEKLVGNYGCFSCHEIPGMLDMMPIGTELTNWGSKTVDKLLFNFAAQEFGLDPNYREGWLMQKLHAPRSFDTKKVLNPTERLRMPYFAFADEQVKSITTFVIGLVDDEVQLAKMKPTPDLAAMDAGLRAVRQNNCAGCHMIDPGTVTFTDESGVSRTVAAELLPLSEDQKVPSPHDLAALKRDAEKNEATEVGLRILRPEPDVKKGMGDKLFVPLDKVTAMGAPNGGDMIRTVTDYYFNGIELLDPTKEGDEAYSYVSGGSGDEWGVYDADGKLRDHSGEPYDKVRWTFAPPVLWNEGGKVQRNWFFGFLHDVQTIRHQVRVRMPSFSFDAGEAEAIADYFAHKSNKEWPSLYARSMRLKEQKDMGALAGEMRMSPTNLSEIEAGVPMATRANFSKVLAYGQGHGFQMNGPVNPAYEATKLRTKAFLDQRKSMLSNHLELGEAVAVKGVNCFQCHYRLGKPPPADPIAWAPDLERVRERLREDWVHDWIVNPPLVYPGTAMPVNFASNPPSFQEQYRGSTNEEQIQVVLEWLYNFDRIYMGNPGQ
ncbi:MAG: c-type cytochrome [Planctomycetota bacterium]|nr:c-type cytochrome [Planctomycetota bacterium]